MKAVVFQGPGSVEVRDVPDPRIEQATDALVRITTSTICGTDIRIFEGLIPAPTGAALGHEFVGVVEEVGEAVRRIRPGQRVVSPFSTSCGGCFWCRKGLLTSCPERQFFGVGQLGGGQGERVRVPLADSTLERLPETVSDTQAAFLSDVLPGALASTEAAAIQPGDVVVVVGCGPTGLCAVLCASLFEPSLILAIDHHPDRLAKAKELGALPLDFERQKYLARVQEATEGRGADVVIEAVGKAPALDMALELARPWGTLVTMGLHMDLDFPLPLRDFSFRHLTWRARPLPPVRNYIPRLIELIEAGRLDPSTIASHTLPLAEAPLAYEMMAQREDGALKVLLKP
jgi:threonine dehydrogenase-like Zn-dependent dehydrogenase